MRSRATRSATAAASARAHELALAYANGTARRCCASCPMHCLLGAKAESWVVEEMNGGRRSRDYLGEREEGRDGVTWEGK